ncbi:MULTISPECIES: thiamine phosphate synthase [unclassified Sphingopyxis]|uniref:thiamine phosphate synthase n=1 Tax=unclassified Sphingopyxis TaxID=2614943 RepID=UPI0007376F11|nr:MULTISPECIES: thiamine phosphate synthase [unclassified Sphingopyxis]KTE37648.1 thiamine monophosphate synthase [Sphingopyxis sp. HIX]KTE76244.1 thiamine monophosphate synthase [Sphingopyxis sp. HXXIV]
MPRRHPLPTLWPQAWLFTDARLGDALFAAVATLPPASGIVLRHDELAPGKRWRLARRLARTGHLLLLAGPPALARRWGADGVHLRQPSAKQAAQAHRLGLIVSMPVHNAREAGAARRARADLAFVSPLHATRSHPGAPALGQKTWLRLARLTGAQPVALGGMTAKRARSLGRASAASGIAPGWAGIDAWMSLAGR